MSEMDNKLSRNLSSTNINKLYSTKVMDHFQHPHNMGKITKPSGKGRVGNPVCGDLMELQIKVEPARNASSIADAGGDKDGQEIITDAKFQTFGCGAAIATSSMLTDLIIGKTLVEALKVSNKAIIEALNGLPITKHHCSVLAEEALQKAVASYRENKKAGRIKL